MTTVAFIGLGNIGLPMAQSMMRGGIDVIGYDLDPANVERAVAAGARAAGSAAQAAAEADAVVTVVPSGLHSRQVYLDDGVIAGARPGTLLIDCSTVDIETAEVLQQTAARAGLEMVDAPVSGGPPRAAEGKLAITVGGTEAAFEKARPILETMAASVHHMGRTGAGVAAKVCNNLVIGIEVVALCEAFTLGRKLGLDPQKLYRSMSASSAASWILSDWCPVPGVSAHSPANEQFKPRGTAHMLLKDLSIAGAAALRTKSPLPVGDAALSMYTLLSTAGHGELDITAVIKLYGWEGA